MAKAVELHPAAEEKAHWSLPSILKDIRDGKVDTNPLTAVEAASIPKQYYGLTQRLFISRASGQPPVIAFTGVDWSAGSRVVCSNVARALAVQTEMPVCLIDVNLQRPDVPRTLSASPGLTEALLQPNQVREVARHVSGSLWALSSNRNADETLRLLTSSRFGELMGTIRSEFRYAVIACPPISSEPAAIPMCGTADTTVLVIGSQSKRADGERAMRVLNSMRIQIAGAVLERSQA
jgi:Mrp family chromosome partitioning ATPase